MCGRFQLTVKAKEIANRYSIEVYDELHRPQKDGSNPPKGTNCAPGQWLPVITNEQTHQISYLRWGLQTFGAKNKQTTRKIINSRIENMMEKSLFRKALQERRCIVPANGFYEWQKGKQPYRLYIANEPIFSMAGIWEVFHKPDGTLLKAFSIITTEAVNSIKHIHHRMPFILSREQESYWLSEKQINNPDILRKPNLETQLMFEKISSLVNFVGNDGSNLLEKKREDLLLF